MQSSQKVCLLFLMSLISSAYCRSDHHNWQEAQNWISFIQGLGFMSTSTFPPTNEESAEVFKERHRHEMSSTEPSESSAVPEIMHGYEDSYEPQKRWVIIGTPIGGIIVLLVCSYCCYKCCCARCGKDVVVHSTVIQQPAPPPQQYQPPTQVVVQNFQQPPQQMAQYPPPYEPPRPHQAWNQFQQQQPPMNQQFQQFSQMPQNFQTPVGEFSPSAPPTYDKY